MTQVNSDLLALYLASASYLKSIQLSETLRNSLGSPGLHLRPDPPPKPASTHPKRALIYINSVLQKHQEIATRTSHINAGSPRPPNLHSGSLLTLGQLQHRRTRGLLNRRDGLSIIRARIFVIPHLCKEYVLPLNVSRLFARHRGVMQGSEGAVEGCHVAVYPHNLNLSELALLRCVCGF